MADRKIKAALAIATLLQCNADNCYRAMTNTPAVASSLCATYLQATTTTTITPTVTLSFTDTILPTTTSVTPLAKDVPTHISSQCVLATATPLDLRLSSACSCISAQPTSTITVTETTFAPAQTITVDPPTACDFTTASESGGSYVVNGVTFDLGCNSVPQAFNFFQSTSATHFSDCIADCTGISDCIGALWSSDGAADGQQCGLISGAWVPIDEQTGTSYALMDSYTLTGY